MALVGTNTFSFIGPITANIIVAHSIIELKRLEISRYKTIVCTVKLAGAIVGTRVCSWLVGPIRTVAKVVINLIESQLDFRMIESMPIFLVIFHIWFVQVKTSGFDSPDSIYSARNKGTNSYQWHQNHE